MSDGCLAWTSGGSKISVFPVTVANLDPDGAASRLAAEGSFALGLGDTAGAADKYGRAGRLLLAESRRPRKATERHLLRFVAATQLYLGGHYGDALKYAKQVDASFLPTFAKPLLLTFLKDAGRRASPSYRRQMLETVKALWAQRKYEELLDRLKDHPFVYAPGPLAFLRAVLCENLGHWRAASEFYAQAVTAMPQASPFAIMAASYSVRLQVAGRLPEAWRYVGALQKVLPGAYTFIAASVISFWCAADVTGEERRDRFREQLVYFDQARSAYAELTPEERDDLDVQLFLSLCFDAALVALMQLGEFERAVAVAGEAIAHMPDAPLPPTARGVLTYPSAAAVRDFRSATRLSGADYVPFYHLSHHAFHSGNLAEAERLCRIALARNPRPQMRAQLTAWLAAFRDSARAPKDEVEVLFRQAFEIDPDNEQVTGLYNAFKGDQTASALAKWDTWVEPVNEWNLQPDRSAGWAHPLRDEIPV